MVLCKKNTVLFKKNYGTIIISKRNSKIEIPFCSIHTFSKLLKISITNFLGSSPQPLYKGLLRTHCGPREDSFQSCASPKTIPWYGPDYTWLNKCICYLGIWSTFTLFSFAKIKWNNSDRVSYSIASSTFWSMKRKWNVNDATVMIIHDQAHVYACT